MLTLENVAALLGLIYLLLAMRERREAWVAGGIASGLFLFVFATADLPMQAALQVYYVAVAVHAWRSWGRSAAADGLQIAYSPVSHLFAAPALWLALSVSVVMARSSSLDPQVWLDTVTSCGSLIATWLVARKRLEAWLYWVLIDASSVALYLLAGLHTSAMLYVIYTVLALMAWISWRKRRLQTRSAA